LTSRLLIAANAVLGPSFESGEEQTSFVSGATTARCRRTASSTPGASSTTVYGSTRSRL